MFPDAEPEYNFYGDRQTNFMSAAKQIPSRFAKNEIKETVQLT